MGHRQCPLCGTKRGVKHTCEVCHRQNCRECCKRYLALKETPVQQVRTCNECFLEHVAWDASRTYDVYGSAADKPIVLVHGALVGRHCLVLEAKALAAVGFRVIVPDLPAHGARFREQPLTLGNALTTLHDIIQKEAPGRKVVIMGFSMGGYVAAAFAAAYPELMAGVLLGGCCHDAHTRTWQLVGHMAEAVYSCCSYRTKAQFIFKSCPDVMSAQRVEIQECFLRAGAEYDAWKYAWRVMYAANMRKLLPQITCPALLVVGEQDFRSHEKKWLSLLQHGNLLVLKGGIHQFMFQPGVCHEYRMNAEGFAAAANWGEQPRAEWMNSSLQQPTVGEEEVSPTHNEPNPPPQAAAAEAPCALHYTQSSAPHQTSEKGKHGVGIGTVVANVLMQFRVGSKKQAGIATASCTGSLLSSAPHSTAA